jgi:hypothetical protein
MASTPPPAQGAQGGKNGQQQVRPRSFLVGTQDVIEGGDYEQSQKLDSAGHTLMPWQLQGTGWLRGLFLEITGAGAANATTSVAFEEDGPFNVLSNIELDDVNNEAIFGPFNGYTAMLANKYGGYFNAGDPRASAVYSATTGTGATAGDFNFVLYIPLEIVARDPLGPLPSVNNTASLTLKMSIAMASDVFSTAPATTEPTVTVKGTQDFYWQPRSADKSGRPIMAQPPGAGTTQYWTQGSIAANAGTINEQLITGLGYPFRTYLFELVDSAGSRAQGESDWPNPFNSLKFEANMLLSNYSKNLWKFRQATDYDYNGAADAANGKENGVYPLNFNKDFAFGKPGSETRRSYLVTSPGSNFIVNATIGGSGTHTLYSIVNYVAPAGGNNGDTASLTGGQ